MNSRLLGAALALVLPLVPVAARPTARVASLSRAVSTPKLRPGPQLSASQFSASQLTLEPQPAAQVEEDRPCVQVSWPKGTLREARLWFNGQDVTSECLRNPDFLSYRPFNAPAPGAVHARFQAVAADGSALERNWDFTVQPTSWIRNLQQSSSDHTLFEDEELTVSFEARPRGRASFQVQGWPSMPMEEVQPGIYRGVHRIRAGDSAMNLPLKVKYQQGDHREEVHTPRPVEIFGGFYKVRVISPVPGSSVDKDFTLIGKARPGCKVSVVPNVGFGDGGRAPDTSSAIYATGLNSTTVSSTTGTPLRGGALGSIPAEVDDQGNFKVDYGLPFYVPGMAVVFSVYSVDQDGTRSLPTVVRYKFK